MPTSLLFSLLSGSEEHSCCWLGAVMLQVGTKEPSLCPAAGLHLGTLNHLGPLDHPGTLNHLGSYIHLGTYFHLGALNQFQSLWHPHELLRVAGSA